MPLLSDRSSRRISSLFSLGSSDSHAPPTDPDQAKPNASPAPVHDPHLAASGNTLPTPHQRSSSGQFLTPDAPQISSSLFRDEPTASQSRSGSPARSRPVSRDFSDPTPVHHNPIDGPPLVEGIAEDKSKKKSKLSKLHRHKHDKQQDPEVWIAGHPDRIQYDLEPLVKGERVPELWDEMGGDTLVYLFPRTSTKGPSFRIHSSFYAASPFLNRLAHGGLPNASTKPSRDAEAEIHNLAITVPQPSPEGRDSAVNAEGAVYSEDLQLNSDLVDSTAPLKHIYLPLTLSSDGAIQESAQSNLTDEDVDKLIIVRNLFAFLVGQSLLATKRRPALFSLFLAVSEYLQIHQFSNFDGSTFGEVATASFDKYVEELRLADVRHSREKTIEGLVLGEKMRSALLYNEAFVHAVGKYEEFADLPTSKFDLISPATRSRLERASMDLFTRLQNGNAKLVDFEFPAIFSGVMNSKTADERKMVRFDAWKSAFMGMRKHVLGFYKDKYGAWPPKASSKKNNLETSGLSRTVLKDLYQDLSNLYDLLVDRTSITTRTLDLPEDELDETEDQSSRALRRVLGEYDRSTPPVQPPMPFDTPLLPSLLVTRKEYGANEKGDSKLRKKNLKGPETETILRASYNQDADISTPFLNAFRDMERRSASGKNITEICDLRNGQWIFLYAVLQSLPMLVVDAPGIKWTRGPEYFLCIPPRSTVPWAREDSVAQRNWYGIAGSTSVINLPADVVENSVESVYRRSHCWIMAERWTQHSVVMQAALMPENMDEPLPPPPGMNADFMGSPRGRSPIGTPRNGSRSSTPTNRDSILINTLEALPVPAGATPPGMSPRLRPTETRDKGMTFDDILKDTNQDKKKGKKKK